MLAGSSIEDQTTLSSQHLLDHDTCTGHLELPVDTFRAKFGEVPRCSWCKIRQIAVLLIFRSYLKDDQTLLSNRRQFVRDN